MRILHLSSLYAPEQVGGAELMVESLARMQVAHGHAVAVACASREAEPAGLRDGVTVYRTGYGTPFHISEWPSRGRLDRMRYKLAAQWNRAVLDGMAGAVRDFRPDVVNTHSLSELPPALWPVLRRLGLPVVHTLHDFTSLCTNGSMTRHGRACAGQHLKCRAYALPHRLCQASVDAVVGVGRDILDRHLAAGFFAAVPPELRRVIWNPIADEARPLPERKAPGGTLTFGYMGRIEPSKGIDGLLQACRALPSSGWRLLVAGRAADGIARYEAMAAGLPIEFVGFAESARFLDGIDCLVVPPVWPEAFGRTVAEAYARNVPVLGTAIGGIAEQIGTHAPDWLVPPGDADALAQAMSRLIAEPARLGGGLANAAALRAGVEPEFVAARYQDVYAAVIARARNLPSTNPCADNPSAQAA